MAYRRYYNDLRLLAKRANQAMVRLEHLGIDSPAYRAAQAELEVLGKERKGDRGRRFNESGKATWVEYEYMKRVLTNFLSMKTRTQSGAKEYWANVWSGAEENAELKLKETGVTKDQWFNFWENMEQDKKARLLGSDVYVRILRTYTYKNKELSDDQKMSAEEIAEAIKNASNVKEAYKAVGITYRDVKKVNSLGAL